MFLSGAYFDLDPIRDIVELKKPKCSSVNSNPLTKAKVAGMRKSPFLARRHQLPNQNVTVNHQTS